ncbi:amidohydrolase family protein [Avibacterium sp. 21-599]|uniref:amidohydrolase family protein n=1 Tax=Avibacterium sp. 21-599 TaxID=2911528 RepID=UPI0022461B66|nr:amidohydrolase family protein [Avibacterium sp. 21-599]MCW9717171.1 amidohydrolase family protein [Avibacterium sp. 21-599]
MKTELYNGPMIDAHQHFWQPHINPHPWLKPDVLIPFRYGDYTAIKKEYLPPDYLKDATPEHNIVATVYVDAEWDPNDPIGETKYIHTIADKFKMPNAVVAQAWLHHDDISDVLEKQASFPLVRSIRHKPAGPSSPEEAKSGGYTLMSDDQWRRGYELLSKFNLNFDLQTPWWNLHEAEQLAKDFPETLIILNHTGLPSDRSKKGLHSWHKAMSQLSEVSNVVVKISGIGLPHKSWNIDDNRWIIQETIKIFGIERCMFASNFPVDSLCGNLNTILTGFKESVKMYSYEEQYKLFFDNAKKIYQIHI